MKKKSHLLEMEHIKDRCVIILDFIAAKYPEFETFSKLTIENLEKNYKTSNRYLYEGFKQAFRDINEMSKTLQLSDQAELNIILSERFGISIDETDTSLVNTIKIIIKKGEILTDEEYELLNNYVNGNYVGILTDDIIIANEMLVRFHKNKLN